MLLDPDPQTNEDPDSGGKKQTDPCGIRSETNIPVNEFFNYKQPEIGRQYFSSRLVPVPLIPRYCMHPPKYRWVPTVPEDVWSGQTVHQSQWT